MSDHQKIKLDVRDQVATITFHQPEVANALDEQSLTEIRDALELVNDREDVGAVVLTGAGKSFSAGFNLKEIPLEGGDTEEIVAHFRVLAARWHEVVNLIPRLRKPVLAAVNGVAAGGGFGLALVSDLAVASEGARFLCAWQSIGIANDTGTSYTLAKIVGFRRAMELMLTNRTLSAEEALQWGIVNRVYPEAEFDGHVARIARDLAAGPTHLQALAKERFHDGFAQSIEECTAAEIENVLASVAHPHFRPVLEKFIRKEGRSNRVQVRLS